jgi:hypothetical protein
MWSGEQRICLVTIIVINYYHIVVFMTLFLFFLFIVLSNISLQQNIMILSVTLGIVSSPARNL